MRPEAARGYCLKLTLFTACLTVLLGVGKAQAGAITINSLCEFGTCSPVDTLALGSSYSDPFSFTYTFANSDRYQVTGTLSATDTTALIEADETFTVTYLGNMSGTSSSADTLIIDFLQIFQTVATGTGSNNSGFDAIYGTFGGPLASTSRVEEQTFTNGGTAMALLGPFFPPGAFSESVTNQPFTFGPTTLLESQNTLSFGAGSGVNAAIQLSTTPPVPEPATLLLLGTGLVGASVRRARARRRR
jgi:hypothetical protein